jgi:regulator of sigma E protease
VVESLTPQVPNAKNAGLLVDDQIIGANDTVLYYFHEFQEFLRNHKEENIDLKVLRNGTDTVVLKVNVTSSGTVGFKPSTVKAFKVDTIRYSWSEAVPAGLRLAYKTMRDQLLGLKKLVTGKIKASESLSGPIGIAQAFGAKWEWEWFWRLTGIISIILAIMNLLPIPGLDGGYAIFIIWEMATGRKMSDKAMTRALNIGLIIILVLTFYALGNDIFKTFRK